MTPKIGEKIRFIPLNKTNFDKKYRIVNFLLEGIEDLLEREKHYGVYPDTNKEQRFGRHLAGMKLAYLTTNHNVSKEKLELAISLLYRDHPDDIDKRHIPSVNGYLLRLEEECI